MTTFEVIAPSGSLVGVTDSPVTAGWLASIAPHSVVIAIAGDSVTMIDPVTELGSLR